jgi:AcrR family transcriptional regulator
MKTAARTRASPATQAAVPPASGKGRKRYEEILDTAISLLIEEGYGAFSMRKIADRMGIRVSLVQYYFPSRGELLRALFERSLQRSIDRFAATADGRTLKAMTTFVLNHQLAPEESRLFWELWALSAHDEAAAEAKERFYRGYRHEIGKVIAPLRPDLPEDEIARRATIITVLLEGASVLRADGSHTKPELDRLDRSIVEAVNAIVRS